VARWHGGMVARWHGGTVARWHGGMVARWHSGTVAEHLTTDPEIEGSNLSQNKMAERKKVLKVPVSA
jgi:hypothetical protein